MTDIFSSYEQGLEELLKRLGKDHPDYAKAAVLQTRLLENIAQTRQYGDTETCRAERAQIIGELNKLAVETVETSFNELCTLAPSESAPITPEELPCPETSSPQTRLMKLREACRAWNRGIIGSELKRRLEGMGAMCEAEEGPPLYVHREQVEKRFAEFLADQESAPIFMMVGEAGMGKTTTMWYLLQRYSSALDGAIETVYPCLFIPAHRIPDEPSGIQHQVRLALAEKGGYTTEVNVFEALDQGVLRPTNQTFILFIDATNESSDPHFSKQLDELSSLVHGTRFKICLSCRTDFWAGMPKGIWSRSMYKDPTQTASAELKEFTADEFEQAREQYFHAYNVQGRMSEAARRICRVPLMMMFFAKAYVGKDLLERESEIQRAYQIFKDYAQNALHRVAHDTDPRLRERLEKLRNTVRLASFEKTADQYVRGFLLQVAGRMWEKSTNRLAIPEELDYLETVMRKVYPELREVDLESNFFKVIVYRALLNERIVFEEVEEKGTGKRSMRFPFEMYLEYTLARYITRDWCQRKLSPAEIVSEFCALMTEHEHKSLLARQTGSNDSRRTVFNSIRGALAFVIQIVEDEDEPFRSQDDFLYLKLLNVLVGAKPAEGKTLTHLMKHEGKEELVTPSVESLYTGLYFTWKALACAVITHLDLVWAFSDKAKQPTKLDHIECLQEIINALGGQRDFVIRWELEGVLVDLATNKRADQFVWSILDDWIKTGGFLRKLYTAEVLGHVGCTAPGRAITTMRELACGEDDFWIRRAIGYAAISLARYLVDKGQGHTVMQIVDVIQPLALDSADPFQRGRLLSQLLELECISRSAWDILGQIKWQSEHHWVRRNVVEALAELVDQAIPKAQQSSLTTLEILAGLEDLSVETRYSVVQALERLARTEPHCAENLLYRVENLLEKMWQSAICQPEEPTEHWVLEAVHQVASDLGLPCPELPPYPIPSMAHRVAILCHPEYLAAPFYNHPECSERLEAVVSDIRQYAQGCVDWLALPPRLASLDNLEKVHRREYIERIRSISEQLAKQPRLSGNQAQVAVLEEFDFEIRPGSYALACRAAGGVMHAAELVGAGQYDLVFCLIRPPGHLAGNKICIFNNVAVATKHYQHFFADKFMSDRDMLCRPRVLIFDCDNHHGLSTFETFVEDDSVLYFSIQQEIVHPGTGRVDQMGQGKGWGYTFGIPIPERSDDRVYPYVLANLFRPVALRFKPDIIFLSAGFDSHYRDRFCNMAFTEQTYHYLAQTLRDVCQQLYQEDGQHRGIVAALEGGYSLESLGRCVLHILNVFSEDNIPIPELSHELPQAMPEEEFQRVEDNVRAVVANMKNIASERSDYLLYDKNVFAPLL